MPDRFHTSIAKSIATHPSTGCPCITPANVFLLGLNPSEWVCGVQIAWDFVLFWLIFVRGNHTEHNKPGQTLGAWHIRKMLGEGAWGSELGQTLSHCEHHPSHLRLGSCGQVTSFSNILVTSFVHWAFLMGYLWSMNERMWETVGTIELAYYTSAVSHLPLRPPP